ncbi:DUF6265 family protein [Flavihumibacter sp.]|uniref:DUF6265 family protein n=1 Tax=Flavihumibacter sp. TaxID=1913981 RepID=UPI002FCBF5A1
MKTIFILTALLYTSFSFMEGGRQTKKDITRLLNLEGLWVRNTAKGHRYEEWKKTGAENLQGSAYSIKGGDTIVSERINLGKKQQQIVYVATVEDQNEKKPVAFFLTRAEKNKYVFENPTHDYPKRIVYEFISKDSLHAWVDGGEMDPGKRLNYYFKRLK